MIDARGALVVPEVGRPHVRVLQPGIVHPTHYQYLPGALEHVKKGCYWLPVNTTPWRDAEISVPKHMPSGRPYRDYQRQGAVWAASIPFGCVIADQVGLGKTATVLAAIRHDPRTANRPICVIAPKLSRTVWCGPDSDAEQHFGIRLARLTGGKPDPEQLRRLTGPVHGVFLNYEIVAAWWRWIAEKVNPGAVIVDERTCFATPAAALTNPLRR